MTKKKVDVAQELAALIGDKPRPTSDNPMVDAFIAQAVFKQDVFVQPPGYDALSELGKAEYERTGKMPTTATPQPLLSEAQHNALLQAQIEDLAREYGELFGKQPQAPAPLFAPNVEDAPRTEAEGLQMYVQRLIDMQHARAAAGKGQSTPWQNAQAHLRKAIECIEQQSEADSKP